VNPHLVEAEESPRRGVEGEDPGLLEVPEVPIEDRTLAKILRSDDEERLITAEGISQVPKAQRGNDDQNAEIDRSDAPACYLGHSPGCHGDRWHRRGHAGATAPATRRR